MTTGQLLDFNTAKRQGEAQRTGVSADDIKDRLNANPRAFVDWLERRAGEAIYDYEGAGLDDDDLARRDAVSPLRDG